MKKKCIIFLCLIATVGCGQNGTITNQGIPDAISHVIYQEFDREENDYTAVNHELPEIVVVCPVIISDEEKLDNRINLYLQEIDAGFRVHIVSHDGENGEMFAICTDMYSERKEKGQQSDILYGNSEQLMELAAHDCLYDVSDFLQNETISHSLEMSVGNSEILESYLNHFRYEDALLGIPCTFTYTTSYLIQYNQEYMDYYGIDLHQNNDDLDLIASMASETLEDQVIPIILDLNENRSDTMLFEMAGLIPYKCYWALKEDSDGIQVIDPLRDESLLDIYNKMGEWRSAGALGYAMNLDDNLYPMDEACDSAAACLIHFCPGAPEYFLAQTMVNFDAYGNLYDTCTEVLDYPIYTDFDYTYAVAVDGETEYPEACEEFLELFYSDMDFRLLFYIGEENNDYRIVESDDTRQLCVQPSDSVTMIAYEITSNLSMFESLEISYYEQLVERQNYLHQNVRQHVSVSFLFSDEIQEKYEACNAIYEKYLPVFWGYYKDETTLYIEEVHEMLLDAGLNDVISEMNNQLKGDANEN